MYIYIYICNILSLISIRITCSSFPVLPRSFLEAGLPTQQPLRFAHAPALLRALLGALRAAVAGVPAGGPR